MINKNDNIYVKRPEIVEKIEYKYTIPENKHYISQDNRPEYKKKQDQSNAQYGYDKYIEDKKTKEGTEKLMGFMNFLDYAGLATGAAGLIGKGISKGIKMATKGAVKKSIDNLNKSAIIKLTPMDIMNIKGGNKYSTPQAAIVEEYIDPDELKRRFIKFARNNEIKNTNDKIRGRESLLLKKLEEYDIDVSGITKEDLEQALNKRIDLLKQKAKEGRFSIIDTDKIIGKTFKIKDFVKDKNNIRQVGEMDIIPNKKGEFYVGGVKNIDELKKEGKVYERGLNSAINLSNQTTKGGVISGWDLKSANKTYKVWDKFEKEKPISYLGEHSNENIIGEQYNNFNNYVYKLNKPSSLETRTKSAIFNPNILDENGKMKVDWNNPDIFKIIGLPLIMKEYEK